VREEFSGEEGREWRRLLEKFMTSHLFSQNNDHSQCKSYSYLNFSNRVVILNYIIIIYNEW